MLFGANWLVLLLTIPGLLYALVFHEYAHGRVAYALGDPTAQLAGRLTLEPWPHLDLWGTVALLLFRFGWAKPVPVDPGYFRRPRRDMILVAAAGPLSNVVFSFVLYLVTYILATTALAHVPYLLEIFELGALISLYLAVFNLLPIPPLDGSQVVAALLSAEGALRYRLIMGRLGFVFLLILLFTSVPTLILYPAVTFVSNGLQSAANGLVVGVLTLLHL